MPAWGLIAVLGGACGTDPGPQAAPLRDRPVAARARALIEPSAREPSPSTSVPEVVDLDGVPADPLGPAAADTTVLVFVGTDCPISNRYAPTLAALDEGWQSQGVKLWLVYPDPDDAPATIREHQRRFSLALPTVRDPGHLLVARAGAVVTPEAAVFVTGVTEPVYRGRIDDRVAERGKVRAEAGAHELRDAVDAVRRGVEPEAAGGPPIGCYISDLR